MVCISVAIRAVSFLALLAELDLWFLFVRYVSCSLRVFAMPVY
jgi:hypothetical protein